MLITLDTGEVLSICIFLPSSFINLIHCLVVILMREMIVMTIVVVVVVIVIVVVLVVVVVLMVIVMVTLFVASVREFNHQRFC